MVVNSSEGKKTEGNKNNMSSTFGVMEVHKSADKMARDNLKVEPE